MKVKVKIFYFGSLSNSVDEDDAIRFTQVELEKMLNR